MDWGGYIYTINALIHLLSKGSIAMQTLKHSNSTIAASAFCQSGEGS